jgi:hypothetical protein
MTFAIGKTNIGTSAVTAMGITSDIHHQSITKTVDKTTRSFHDNQFGSPSVIAHARTTGMNKFIFRMDEFNNSSIILCDLYEYAFVYPLKN